MSIIFKRARRFFGSETFSVKSSGFIIMEGSGYILQEDGSHILLES